MSRASAMTAEPRWSANSATTLPRSNASEAAKGPADLRIRRYGTRNVAE